MCSEPAVQTSKTVVILIISPPLLSGSMYLQPAFLSLPAFPDTSMKPWKNINPSGKDLFGYKARKPTHTSLREKTLLELLTW